VRAFGARYESTYRQICVRGLRPLQGESASGSESAREFENCVVRRSDRRVDLEVVSGVLVGGYRLSARETSESVAAHSVPLLSDLRGTPDADPDDVDAGERTGPVVRARLVDDDFVDNDVQAHARRGSDACLVRAQQLSTDAADADPRSLGRPL
jgi:hypothetical protein